MNANKFKAVTRPKKSVEVFYVPDEVLEKIIPNDPQKYSDGNKRKPTLGYDLSRIKDYVNSNQSPVGQRTTRSGRPIANQFRQLSISDTPENQFSDAIELESEEHSEVEKPEDVLFDEEEVGGAIYSFQSRKRQDGMMSKASESLKLSDYRSPGRGRGRGRIYYQNHGEGTHPPNTPYGLRNKIRKRLADEAAKQELDRLLEDSESDFVPSSSGSESESESNSDSDSDPQPTRLNGTPTVHTPVSTQMHTPSIKTKSKKMKDYVFQSEDYFDRQYAKIMTSNNRLSKLKNPKMAPNKLSSILKKVEKKHIQSYQHRESIIEKSFKRWLFAFSEGFNVMLYGLGSKIHILENFHSKWLTNSYSFHIKGYFPDNTIKEILSTIATAFLQSKDVPTVPHELLELIRKEMDSKYAHRIYILISNLDGKFLQNEKSQSLFSELVKIPKIHLLASTDHINSPLLWEQSKLSAYNFIWEDCTTFSPYTEETSYEGSLMVNWSGGVALSSVRNVFTSLTTNSRKVFKILLNHHLDHVGPKYQGMAFSELYRECRSGFVVSSDLALRTLLTEFIDHQLVKWRKETDQLLITVETSVLIQFRAEMDCLN